MTMAATARLREVARSPEKDAAIRPVKAIDSMVMRALKLSIAHRPPKRTKGDISIP